MCEVDWRIPLSRGQVSKVWKELKDIEIDGNTCDIALDTIDGWTVAHFCLNRALHTTTHAQLITVDEAGRGQSLDEAGLGDVAVNPAAQRRRHNRRVREGLTRSLTVPEMTLAQVRTWVGAIRTLEISERTLDETQIELSEPSSITNTRFWTLRQFVTFYVLRTRKNKLAS